MRQSFKVSIVSCWVLALALGCGEAPPPPPPEQGSDATSELDYVNKASMAMMLGDQGNRYAPDSAKELGDGKFEIEDTAGNKYSVTVTKEGDGYKMSKPEPAK
ncbi:MAG: hypothetical protein O2955_20630 [Planctomycetota bacterium]|nr:hypothetical protein [Planctomycetota bacterium]MDA1214916.1 hypothetical protein [Planctomycetota bacterium]